MKVNALNISPSREEFALQWKPGAVIPLTADILADLETPLSVFARLAYEQDGTRKSYSFLLESVEGGDQIGRYCFLGADPLQVLRKKGKTISLDDGQTWQADADIFTEMSAWLTKKNYIGREGLPPFSGGAVGFAPYETMTDIEERVPCADTEDVESTEAIFGIYDTLLAFDRVQHKLILISHSREQDTDAQSAWDAAAARLQNLIDLMQLPQRLDPVSLQISEPQTAKSNMTAEHFRDMVLTAKEYIRSGDIIQVVLSQRFEVADAPEPIKLMRALRSINPSPYMFCLHFGEDLALVGASPEIHASLEGDVVTVRPIAGTRKRGLSAEEDRALSADLLADPKERAEHIMLVDLARNDIGRIAATGSVELNQLMIVEKYSHVLHIVSEVQGKVRPGTDAGRVMASTFPAGTVSGAPKIRAMEIIAELEQDNRGPYAGAVTYFSFDGNVDSCIAIRTCVLKNGKAYVQAGAGIVADSDPQAEYEETCSKARGMMVALHCAKQM